MAEYNPAQRPCHETDRERREREQGTDQRIELREEDLVEHQGGRRAVDEEVVPLQRGADQTSHDDATYDEAWVVEGLGGIGTPSSADSRRCCLSTDPTMSLRNRRRVRASALREGRSGMDWSRIWNRPGSCAASL